MQKFNLNCVEDSRKIIIEKMKSMFSSSNINLLIGSAFSVPYLKTLADVEKRLSEAMQSGNKNEEFKIKKEFFLGSIEPIQKVDFYKNDFIVKQDFIRSITDIVALRETSIVHKIINIFTTNYDNLIEKALEKNHIDYFDGFSGRINPKFSTANYGKLICKQNGFQGRLTEEVSVNLYKIHGSLYWKEEKDDIVFDDFNERINNISAAKENQEDFLENYSKLAIINPEKNKFNSTVMNSNYYDQIRMFANDMERQNAILLSFGFSFADEHILQIIDRALGTNPTLTLLLFPYCQEDLEKFNEIFESRNNVYCYYKKQQDKGKIDNFILENMNELLMEIYNGIK